MISVSNWYVLRLDGIHLLWPVYRLNITGLYNRHTHFSMHIYFLITVWDNLCIVTCGSLIVTGFDHCAWLLDYFLLKLLITWLWFEGPKSQPCWFVHSCSSESLDGIDLNTILWSRLKMLQHTSAFLLVVKQNVSFILFLPHTELLIPSCFYHLGSVWLPGGSSQWRRRSIMFIITSNCLVRWLITTHSHLQSVLVSCNLARPHPLMKENCLLYQVGMPWASVTSNVLWQVSENKLG